MNKKLYIGSGLIISILFFIIWYIQLSGGSEVRLWRGFLINYLFFNSLAGGLVVWPAIVIAAHGKWMANAEKWCWTGLSFALPSIIALVILWIGADSWTIDTELEKTDFFWLNHDFLFLRNIIAQIAFWLLGFYLLRSRHSDNFRKIAYKLLVVFALSFSLLGFDLVMTLERGWYSMMMGGYFFISAVYVAGSAWILLTLFSGIRDKSILQDQGKLLLAFCMFTAYLMFSHLFPIWYGNNTHEVSFLIPRMNYSWKWISYLLLFMVYVGPFIFLLPSYSKRHPFILGTIAMIVFAGMWIERWWLVSAVFENQISLGMPEIIPAVAFLFLFAAGILIFKSIVHRNLKSEKI